MLRLRSGGPQRLLRRNAAVRNNSSEATKQPPLSKPFEGVPAAEVQPRTRNVKPIVIAAVGLSTGGAGILGYAFYDPRFRHDVEINLPFMSKVFNATFAFLGLEHKRQQHSIVSTPTAVARPEVKTDMSFSHFSKAVKSPPNKADRESQPSIPQQAAAEVADGIAMPPPAADELPAIQAANLVAESILGGEAPDHGKSDEPDVSSSALKDESTQASTVQKDKPEEPQVHPKSSVSTTAEQSEKHETHVPSTGSAGTKAEQSQKHETHMPPLSSAGTKAEQSQKLEEAKAALTKKRVAEFEKSLAQQLEETRSAALEAMRLLRLVGDAAAAQIERIGKADDGAQAAALLQGRQAASAEAMHAAQEAEAAVKRLQLFINTSKADTSIAVSPLVESALHSASQMTKDLHAAIAEVTKIESKTIKMAEYVEKLEDGELHNQRDVSGARLSEEELNSLIAHAHRRIDQLRKQLHEQKEAELQNVQTAIAEQQRADERKLSERMDLELTRLRSQFEAEKKQWDAEARAAAERELRIQLTRQAAAHSDHLAEVLRVQRDELERRFDRELKQHTVTERNLVIAELSQYMARARGVEAALAIRANLEQRVQKMQLLLFACQALTDAIQQGKEGLSWEDRLRPLAKEVAAVESSARNEFITKILSSVPEKALVRGVWTVTSLQKRFDLVRRSCERVALLDDDNDVEPSLLKYLASYIQSLFVIRRPACFLDEEDEVDIEELDTYALLSHAAHFVAAGNLEQAVRYVSQLKGIPRRVASGWLSEARLLLETQQIASAVGAFANARRLGNMF